MRVWLAGHLEMVRDERALGYKFSPCQVCGYRHCQDEDICFRCGWQQDYSITPDDEWSYSMGCNLSEYKLWWSDILHKAGSFYPAFLKLGIIEDEFSIFHFLREKHPFPE